MNKDKAGQIISEVINRYNTDIKRKKPINLVAWVDDAQYCDAHENLPQKTVWIDPETKEETNEEKEHQESPKRTKIIRGALKKFGLTDIMFQIPSVSVRKTHVEYCHDPEYIKLLFHLSKLNKPVTVPEPSSEISMKNHKSLGSILASIGCVFGAVQSVCGNVDANTNLKIYKDKRVTKVYCNVRPPGHHAHIKHGAGFCFLNNVALGAEYALRNYDHIKKVLIFDWDLHHGDGTQNVFWDNENVLYCSFHRGGTKDEPFYPNTGFNDERGKHGNVRNFPLPKNVTIEQYMDKFNNEFMPLAQQFDPDLIMISAGFDSHKDDMYHELPLDYEHFRYMTHELMKLADSCADGRLVSVLEGGYTLPVLARCVSVHVCAMIEGYDE